jgi:hypothetical protein
VQYSISIFMAALRRKHGARVHCAPGGSPVMLINRLMVLS